MDIVKIAIDQANIVVYLFKLFTVAVDDAIVEADTVTKDIAITDL